MPRKEAKVNLPFEEHVPFGAYAVWVFLKANARGIANAKHAKEIVEAVDCSGERHLRRCTEYISNNLMGNGEPVLCGHSKIGYYIAETEEEKAVALRNVKRFTLSMLRRWQRMDKSFSIERLERELKLPEMR